MMNKEPTRWVGSILLQLPGSLVYAALLEREVRVNVEIKGGVDIGVAQQGTHGFVVAAAFYAAGGKTVPEPVKADGRQL